MIRGLALIPRRCLVTSQIYSTANLIQANMKEGSVKRYDIVKSPEDDRLYRGLVLSNGLKAVLVSDPTTDKSAAALDVNVGCMSDPTELPGLAHFLEHMLFLGTEKYPDENAYSKFLSEHGGFSNAFTANDHTNYYFDVSPKHLENALDRFAQFFLHPLFTESATDREVLAVNSEHEKNIPSDSWRLNQLEHSLADPSHDFYKFGTGNIETLQEGPKKTGINVRQELLNFHKKWYSSNIMGLAVVGNQSLDSLEETVLELFSSVENKDVKVPEYNEHPYTPEKAKSCTYTVPIKDIRLLNITFPIPDLEPYYKSGPGHYLGHLIGHEGKGSLLSELKALRWANSLVGGQRGGSKGFDFFVVNLDLTEEGLEHIEEIVLLVFQYLEMLRTKEGIQEWIFEECKNISAMQFRFKDKEKPSDNACRIAGRLQTYPIEEILTGSSILTEWRPDLIQMILDKLVPDNVFLTVVAKKFEEIATEVEPWYGTKYVTRPIPETEIAKWKQPKVNPKFRIPDKNDFIPSDFDLVPRDTDDTEKGPTIIEETDLYRLWFKQDNEFKRPKACLFFQFVSPLAYLNPHLSNVTYLWAQLVKDDLNEYSYAAELAGLHYYLSSTKTGLTLSISGYHQKQSVLLKKILSHISTFRANRERFDALKELYVRGLKNFKMEQPYKHSQYYNHLNLSTHVWSKEEKIQVLERLTFESVDDFIEQLTSFGMFVEVLAHGNLTPDNAQYVGKILSDSFPKCTTLFRSQLILDREVCFDQGSNFYTSVTTDVHKSSCIEFYLQCGTEETRSNVTLDLFNQLIHEQCFDTLRTKEQLGYIVYSVVSRPRGVQSLRVIIQSSRKPDYLDQRIEQFLWSVRKHLENMSEEDFEKHKSSLADRITEKPKKLSARTEKYWSEIVTRQYNFDRDDVEVSVLKTLTKNDIIDFYDNYISAQSPNRRKIAAHVVSTLDGEEEPKETLVMDGPIVPERVPVGDPVEFKSSHPLWPIRSPYKMLSELTRTKPSAFPEP